MENVILQVFIKINHNLYQIYIIHKEKHILIKYLINLHQELYNKNNK